MASGYRREAGDASPVDEARVEAMLEQRNELRKARNWNAADRLRDKMAIELGVTIQDNEMIWYASRGDGAATSHGRRGYDRGGSGGGDYSDDGYSARYDRRSSSRGRGSSYGGGGYGGDSQKRQQRRDRDERRMASRAAPYKRAETCSASLSPDTIATIESLVEQRLRKKLDRRFDEADALLAQLESAPLNVAVSDDAREWRADGQSFVYTYKRVGPASSQLLRGGAVSEWDVLAVLKVGAPISTSCFSYFSHLLHLAFRLSLRALLQERGVAKAGRQFEDADRLLQKLEAMGVDVDDRTRTWWYDEGVGYSGGEMGGGEMGGGSKYGGGNQQDGGSYGGFGRADGYSGYQESGFSGGGGGGSGGGGSGGGGSSGGGGRRYASGAGGGVGSPRRGAGPGAGPSARQSREYYGGSGGGGDLRSRRGGRGGGDEGRWGGSEGRGGGGRGGRGSGRGGYTSARSGSGGHDYVRSATDAFDLPPSKAEAISSLLGQRLAAKKAREFEKADALQAELRGIGVEVDDKSREWHVRPALLGGDDVVDY